MSFSIDGGADAAQFNIAATSGDLSFATPPDFENPADADGDNVYEVDLAVSDGQGARTLQSVAITITDVVESSGTRYVDEVFANVDVQRAIQFATVDTPDGPQDLLMDVYQPSGDSLVDRPIMIAMSGGGFVGMDRLNVEPIARTFARRGYVAVSIDYRVLGRQPLDGDELAIAGTQAVHDLYGAVRFLRAEASGINQFGTNANQIFVSGESAGGVIAAIAATLDPTDTISLTVVADYLAANGGVYGEVGDNDAQASAIQGAMPLSGAILELASVDANSAPMYAAHEELDPVVPCGTTAEGSSGTGLIVSGACDIVPAYTAAGAVAELFLVANSSGHVSFTPQQRTQIYNGAATLFFNEVINAGN